jgi:hypothetical protein
MVVVFILLFVMACHMIAHSFAVTPRMDFQTKGLGFGRVDVADARIHGSLAQSQPNVAHARVERSTDWTESVRTIEDATDALPDLA